MKWIVGIVIGIFITFNYPEVAHEIMKWVMYAIDTVMDMVQR